MREIALPLTALQSSGSQWRWGDVEQDAFLALQRAITTAPTLAAFDPSKPLYVHTDASGFAIAGWLGQPVDGAELPSPLPTTKTG